jgi:hypothetical protein
MSNIITENILPDNNDKSFAKLPPMPPNEKLEEISMSNIRVEHSQKSTYNLTNTIYKLRKQRQLHRMCAQYYERQNSLINIPAIAISGAATVYSFAYPSDGPQEQIFINKIIAGTLSAINTILFSVGGFLKLQAKCESHFIAAEEYDNLLTMINFEINFPNENIQEVVDIFLQNILLKNMIHYIQKNKMMMV